MARTDALTAFPSAGAVLADGFPNLTAKETIMPQIGQFTREESRIVGRIETFTLFHDLVIVPADPSDAENAPDYRIHDHDPGVRDIGPEIGAGWKRTGEKAGEYIALVIDDPGLAQPIRANLFRDDDAGNTWSLHWSRQRDRGEKD
jgi:uncharacterized protein (DUF736 family)